MLSPCPSLDAGFHHRAATSIVVSGDPPRPLRIAHCIHGLGLGGAQQIIAQLVRGTARDEFQHFCYASRTGVFHERVERAGATVRILPRHLLKFDPSWVRSLARSMREDRIDIVHTYLFGDSLHGYLATKRANGIPVLMSLHTNRRGQNLLQRTGYGWLLHRVALTVACSETVRTSFQPHTPLPEQRFLVVANGLDSNEIGATGSTGRDPFTASYDVPKEAILIGAVGRLVAIKDFPLLIRAFARLRATTDADVRLAIIGDGPHAGRLKRLAKREGVADRVIFTGFRDDVLACMRRMDVVAMTSFYEAMPVTVLEAMALGRAIVATRSPGIVDTVRDGEEAVLVDGRDPRSLSEALLRVVADPHLRSRLGASARARFDRDFTASRMVGRYQDLYRSLASRRSGQRARPLPGGDIEQWL